MITISLTTVGRRSGQERRVTLYAVEDGDALGIAGSGAASRVMRQPGWVYNLRENPRARVRRDKVEYDVVAREAERQDRERIWSALCEAFPAYVRLQERAPFRFAVFVLEPVRPIDT